MTLTHSWNLRSNSTNIFQLKMQLPKPLFFSTSMIRRWARVSDFAEVYLYTQVADGIPHEESENCNMEALKQVCAWGCLNSNIDN